MSDRTRFLLLLSLAWAACGLLSFPHAPRAMDPWQWLAKGNVFERSETMTMRGYGDLAYRYALPEEERAYRTTVFTSDRHGFRNSREIQRPQVVVVGDSVVGGWGMSDSETFPVRLAERLGVPVYNYATSYPFAGPSMFARDGRFLAHPPRVVVLAPVARHVAPIRSLPLKLTGLDWLEDLLGQLNTRLNRSNRLTKACRVWFHQLKYRLGGPPPHIEVDGQRALVLSLQLQKLTSSHQARKLKATIDSLDRFRHYLLARNIALVFCPIPEPGSIYPDRFAESDRRWLVQPSFNQALLEGLRSRGVVCVDLVPAFTNSRSPYLFHLDDTHWTPRAASLAADAVAPVVSRLKAVGGVR